MPSGNTGRGTHMTGTADADPPTTEPSRRAHPHRRGAPLALLSSLGLAALVAVAIAGPRWGMLLSIMASITLAVTALNRMFPASRLLWIAFVNLTAVYATIFALFVDDVFTHTSSSVLAAGFPLPIALFLVGCWWQRGRITRALAAPALTSERGLIPAIAWLLPVGGVGASVIALSRFFGSAVNSDGGFLLAMLAIGLVVLAASRDVAIFLVDTGLLFDEFFERISHLLVPAFAFLTVYSLLVLVFASLYSLVSRHALEPHFRIATEARPLTFPEALHFSVSTLSTVGYGDIVPATSLSRTLAAIQVVLGTLLLLFGVSEMLAYAKDRRRLRRRDPQE